MNRRVQLLKVMPAVIFALWAGFAAANEAQKGAERQGYADGREFAYDNKIRGIPVTKDVCLAGSKVAADNLPSNVPRGERNTYGAAVFNGCMAAR